MMALGISKGQIGLPRAPRQSPPRLLYAGRLLYWKGVHIAIEAMTALVNRIPNLRLTIVGNGPEEGRLKADVVLRGLSGNVDFISQMPQEKFFHLYESHDLLLFPSLHDSAGCVVLEALSHGMPVACLDLGGPKDIVTPQCGIIVKTGELTTAQVAARFADEIYVALSSPPLLAQLSAGAIARANEFLLSTNVTKLYDDACRVIRGGSRTTARQVNSPVDSAVLPVSGECPPRAAGSMPENAPATDTTGACGSPS
jgi:glycosyltransferase involved in cell wall biosynthesis